MSSNSFQFKQFTIHHDQCAMKVGTDGVLLGAYANVTDAYNVLDIGTGTGLIATMLAQRSYAHIDAVEIDKNAFQQSKTNFENSPWNNRLQVYHNSFQEYVSISYKKYDVIVSNPPYFSNSLKTPEENRTIARHNDTLKPNELLLGTSTLLTENGRFYVIFPFLDAQQFIDEAIHHQLYCISKLIVYNNPTSKPTRAIMEFSKNQKMVTETYIYIRNEKKEYSEDYQKLTREFYLKFQ